MNAFPAGYRPQFDAGTVVLLRNGEPLYTYSEAWELDVICHDAWEHALDTEDEISALNALLRRS